MRYRILFFVLVGVGGIATALVMRPQQNIPRPRDVPESTESSASSSLATPLYAFPSFDAANVVESDHLSIEQLRATADPALALALAHDGIQRYSGSPFNEERESRVIEALAALDRIGEAHTQAEEFVERHPNGPYAEHISRLMGVHSHMNR